MIPAELLYSDQHEWVRVEDQTATVGISDHAQQALGDITFVELPAVGVPVKKGAEICAIESCKAAANIYAPADGKALAVNTELEDNPGLINSDPYGQGWILKISLDDKGQLDDLLAHDKYAELIGGQD